MADYPKRSNQEIPKRSEYRKKIDPDKHRSFIRNRVMNLHDRNRTNRIQRMSRILRSTT